MEPGTALQRLTALLPLKQRQDKLAPPVKRIHQCILQSLAQKGSAPEWNELQAVFKGGDIHNAVRVLADADLIVQDNSTGEVTGAYPMSVAKTPHEVIFKNHRLYAMCALDAVAIAPVFDTEVLIRSVCHGTGEPVSIHQQPECSTVEPNQQLMIGIRWQQTNDCAAHSLCTEMVFFKDAATAQQWQAGDTASKSVLTLAQGITVGTAFFKPLLD